MDKEKIMARKMAMGLGDRNFFKIGSNPVRKKYAELVQRYLKKTYPKTYEKEHLWNLSERVIRENS